MNGVSEPTIRAYLVEAFKKYYAEAASSEVSTESGLSINEIPVAVVTGIIRETPDLVIYPLDILTLYPLLGNRDHKRDTRLIYLQTRGCVRKCVIQRI